MAAHLKSVDGNMGKARKVRSTMHKQGKPLGTKVFYGVLDGMLFEHLPTEWDIKSICPLSGTSKASAH